MLFNKRTALSFQVSVSVDLHVRVCVLKIVRTIKLPCIYTWCIMVEYCVGDTDQAVCSPAITIQLTMQEYTKWST